MSAVQYCSASRNNELYYNTFSVLMLLALVPQIKMAMELLKSTTVKFLHCL